MRASAAVTHSRSRRVRLSFLLAAVAIASLVAGSPAQAQDRKQPRWLAYGPAEGEHGYPYQQFSQYKPDYELERFHARESVWVFGEGQMMLLKWVPVARDDKGRLVFRIRFSFLSRDNVDDLLRFAGDRAALDRYLAVMTAGPLAQVTSDLFSGQAGLYADQDPQGQPPVRTRLSQPLVAILLKSREMKALLDAKYGPGEEGARGRLKHAARSLVDDLALDAQVYPAVGDYGADTRLAIHFPGYKPGIPVVGVDTVAQGWNSVISMGKDPELWMNAQGLSADDLFSGNRRWAIVIGSNTHLDYDGKQTASKDVAADARDHRDYLGMLTPVGRQAKGLLYRALVALNSSLGGVPPAVLAGERNVVSHSTGYYLARDFLHHVPKLWPAPAKTRYFAISPNIRGSTMIGREVQAYDSQDDMYRDNWHWLRGYRLNETTRAVANYGGLDSVEAHVMLAYGDMTTAGIGGKMSTVRGNIGVVDYTNYQPHYGSGPFNIDNDEWGRLKRFSPYESLYNLRNDGGPLRKNRAIPEWRNGGDDHLRGFPERSTTLSVFGENVNLEAQGPSDGADYSKDHSELAQRMMVMKLIVSGAEPRLDYVPASGSPFSIPIYYTITKAGTVVFSWSRSPNQEHADTGGSVGGQIYEVLRRVRGNVALKGWADNWFQRVGLARAGRRDEFRTEYRTFETIRGVEDELGRKHGTWLFLTDYDSENLFMPTWLDGAFNSRDLWVRVQNGPLEGGFFRVLENEDYVGIGYNHAGALGQPSEFPDKTNIRLRVEGNPAFGEQKPDAYETLTDFNFRRNYITLGGVEYEYTVAFYGPIEKVRKRVSATRYFDEGEQDENKGTGHFLSMDLPTPASHLTDTISPVVSFGP